MKKIVQYISLILLLVAMTGCYGYRQVGLLQERDDLPQYDSVAYQPYRLQVNDEIIYRVITMDRHWLRLCQAMKIQTHNMPIHTVFIQMVLWIFHSWRQ